jgi:hypothetical protein
MAGATPKTAHAPSAARISKSERVTGDLLSRGRTNPRYPAFAFV